ncbi:MAG: hypothetical protein JW894_08890 [Bacteroidales bacterium]|nr:hypothetical protein [Bacteroidales bacterium]
MKIHFIILLLIVLFITSCDKSDNHSGTSNHELVLINEAFTHENSDDDNRRMGFSIFSLPEYAPSDWEQPINYKDGEVFFRVSVLTKPDNRIIYYQMGFQWEEGCNGHPFKEKFADNSLIQITEPGVYQASQTIETFWEPDCQEYDPIDWTERITRLLVVIWDENFHIIDNRWGYGDNIENIDGYYPMDVHYQVIVVPYGETFRGWAYYPITLP